MSDASTYPVTFPYGATSYPYGTAQYPYHRGEDRYMPIGTPVIVNGVQIGLSGQTGFVTGPHLHIGRFVNGSDTNPSGGGFNLAVPATITDFGYDATNGNYVGIRDALGTRWVYLHLNSSNVSVGQILQGGTMPPSIVASDKQIDDAINLARILAGLPDSTLGQLLNVYRPELKNNFVEGNEQMHKNLIGDPNAAINKPSGGNIATGTYLKLDPNAIVEVK